MNCLRCGSKTNSKSICDRCGFDLKKDLIVGINRIWPVIELPQINSTKRNRKLSDLDEKAARRVMDIIFGIGSISYTEGSKSRVASARAAYNALPERQKALVQNYMILLEAETQFNIHSRMALEQR